MSIRTEDSAWKLATMTTRGKDSYAHLSTASGSASKLDVAWTEATVLMPSAR